MIRESNGHAGKNLLRPSPGALLQSIEFHLSQSKWTSDDKANNAQQLYYDACETPTEKRKVELIQRALELDPTNVDALLRAVMHSGAKGEEEIELLRKIVTVAEKKLGPKVFQELAGAFWGFIETRPYMRARERLAEALRASGQHEEAITEYQAMLKLNPGDNQGVRYSLLSSLLVLNRLEEVRELFKKYPEFEFHAAFAWGRVLERFLSADMPGASKALTVARKQNRAMEAYVTGKCRVSGSLPDAYSPGSIEEALCFADGVRTAWEKHPTALKWVESQQKNKPTSGRTL